MWTPGDFDDYRSLWPATPDFERPDAALTDQFNELWSRDPSRFDLDGRLAAAIGSTRIVFLRGYLGDLMPGNLDAPIQALTGLGRAAERAPTNTRHSIERNVDRLSEWPGQGTDPLILVGHSKGGLEALTLCLRHPEVADRVRGVVLSQTPRGGSAVLESLLQRRHQDSLGTKRWAEEWTQRIGLRAVGAHGAGLELTGERLREVVARIDAAPRSFPVWQTASWSSQPTTWLDSFHERLGEIRPGCAHDGQFFLEDLIWPGLPHVLLPHVDHAQPAMGGFGFDHVRYWKVLLTLFGEAHPA